MAKIADRYLLVDPWKIIEAGFHPEKSKVSESLFSLGNEYQGVTRVFRGRLFR
jgi:maltose phosphorylase